MTKSLNLGRTAKIKGDVAPALEKAYPSISAKYTGVPPFDTFKQDFFDRNRPIFAKVQVTLVNELVNRGMGFAVFGKSVDPNFASKAAEVMNMGLNMDEIDRSRVDAWKTAKLKLGQ